MTEDKQQEIQAQEYDASQIQVLEGLEAVRMRPGMYIGSTSKEGLHHLDIQEKTGRPAVETVFTVLHAGGKFGGGGYKVSGGLHGVGSSVVNALSTSLDVRVYKNGSIHYQEYRRGQVVDDLKVIGETDRTGIKQTDSRISLFESWFAYFFDG